MKAYQIIGLGYGDEGKGSITDYLVRKTGAKNVVRFNGGSQAAHNVVTSEGKHHTFAQFGSGTLIPGTNTYLSKYCLVNIFNLFPEEQHLQSIGITDGFSRLFIDKNAPLITPYHAAMNRIKETARSENKHGSCGQGIGETAGDFEKYENEVPLVGDLLDSAVLLKKLNFIRDLKYRERFASKIRAKAYKICEEENKILYDLELEDLVSAYMEFASKIKIVDGEYLERALEQDIIFEGAQGALIDENYGFHPYTTWSNTTFHNADELLTSFGYQGEITKLGLLRSYMVRHGPGPFPTEDLELENSIKDVEKHNDTGRWQGKVRTGYFDFVAAKYALEVVGPLDGLVITHMDVINHFPRWNFCETYDDRNNVKISKIQKSPNPDLIFQENLTNELMFCKPNYDFLINRDEEYFLMAIEHNLKQKIIITSHGPTEIDKKILNENLI